MKRINFDLLTEQEIIEKLSSDDYEGGNILLSPDSSPEEKIKYKIGKAILTYQQDNCLSLKEVSQKLVISEEELYDICRGKINDFSLERLIKLSPWKLQLIPLICTRCQSKIKKDVYYIPSDKRKKFPLCSNCAPTKCNEREKRKQEEIHRENS